MSFNKLPLALTAAIMIAALAPVHAADTAPTSAPNTIQKAAFHLAYCLQFLSDRQQRYLDDVQGLSSIDEGEATDKYVNDLEKQSGSLRKFEASALTLALDDLVKIEGPEKALESVDPMTKMLSTPLPAHKKKESKDQRVNEILGTIDEVRSVQDSLTALQFNLKPILKLQGGDESLWALDLGRSLAARRSAPLTKASIDAQNNDVTALLARAPKTIPGPILDSVHALAPPPPSIGAPATGGGNLSGLLPSDAPAPPTPAAHAAEAALLAAYGASDVDGKLGGGK